MQILQVDELVCPSCLRDLGRGGVGGGLGFGMLSCGSCSRRYPVFAGVPALYRESAVRGTDRFMRVLYDTFAAFHDPAVRMALPLFQGSTERQLRQAVMDRLEVESVEAESEDGIVRILEVGVGTGANLPYLEDALPTGSEVQVWGCDLSKTMLARCAKRVRDIQRFDVSLCLADAHELPFASASFDRVFHVGGIGGYRDQEKALAEMVRVARPGTPIVVVDEQLSPTGKADPATRLLFRMFTAYELNPRAPVDLLPEGVTGVEVEQVGEMFYLMRLNSA
jgi:ubiquinone/menaquinone biosynthesis C-methylase UbiE/uncharacterized protein YbaR (Trm112 family)